MRRTAFGLRRESGFTFVEIMVTLFISLLVVAGMYQSFNTLHKWWVSAGLQSEQRQNARAGLETLTRDIEMAGYQTSSYGDINKSGIAITLAAANEIEMDQQRPDSTKITLASALQVYEPRLVYYHLATDIKTGRQNLYRQIRTQPGLPTPDEIVAENVSAFRLDYFDDKDPASPGVIGLPPATPGGFAAYIPGTAVDAGSPLRGIRRIQVTLTTTTARVLPFGPGTKDYTLKASVTPQNLASTNEVTADTTAPAVPSGLQVYDTRSCGGKLRVRWNNNTELDLAGYVVFYGATSKIVVPVNALANKNAPEITLNPEALLITKFADSGRAGSTANTPNTYAIQISAYDSGGNYTARSAVASGNPDPDNTAFAGVDDTTVNPLKPTPPNTDAAGVRTPVSVAPGASDGELVVTWQAPEDGTATVGFRLYRSTVGFADGHIDNAHQIAMEATLTAQMADPATRELTWTDAGLEGCQTYHYAVASVNCDETLVAGYLHDSTNPALSDYAVGSGAPLDTVLPPAPGLAAAIPDMQRAFITLVNPLALVSPDFDRTEIFWSKVAAPVLDASTGVVSGGTRLPDSDAGTASIFRNRGTQVIVFDSETEAVPSLPALEAGATYYLIAVSYDRCNNPSAPATETLILPAAACMDNPLGPPDSLFFTNRKFTSCQSGAVELGWDYPGTDIVPDLAGFRVSRRPGAAAPVEIAAGPTSLKSWIDAGASVAGPLQDGMEYTYLIYATDCLYEQDKVTYSANRSLPLEIGPIRPGLLRRYQPDGSGGELDAVNFVTTVSDVPASYTYHNNVKFYLQNTSRSLMTIRKMAVTWDNPNVVLDSVTIGGTTNTPLRTVSAGGAASGAAFTVDVDIEDVAGGVGSPSGAVSVLLRFMTPAGAVNRLADMRSQTLNLSLWVWNKSLQDVECPGATRVAIDVPRGPLLGGFSQSAPGMFGIDSYAVVGTSGTARDTDIKVPFGSDVNVFGTAFDNSRDLFADGVNRGFSTLQVVGISAAAADPAAIPLMPAVPSPVTSPGFERPLQNIGGNRYAIHRTSPTVDGALMPQVSDKVNWYFGLAVDATGNWDRVPDPDYGNYAYFQRAFNVCVVTPRAPVLTLTATTAASALLTWTAPTQYDDGTAIPGLDSLTYDVYVKSAGGDPWPSTPAGADLTGLSFTHSANLLTGTYFYMVRAKNSCVPPRVSDYSNVVMECEGPSTVDCSLFSVPTTARYGDPIALAMSGICAYRNDGVHNDSVVVFRVQSGSTTTNFPAPEVYDLGAFAKTITAVWSGGGGNNVLAPSGSLSVNLEVGGTPFCTARTVTITGGECYTIPNPPTSFSAVAGAVAGTVNMTWFRPNFNTDGTPITDLAGYQIERRRCSSTGVGLAEASCGSWTAWVPVQLDDPAAQSYTWSGMASDERFQFQLKAKDTCATPNFSTYIKQSNMVRVP